MKIFGRDRSSSGSGYWAETSPQVVYELRSALLDFVVAALDHLYLLAVSPGSPESQQFREELDRIHREVIDRVPTAEDLEQARRDLTKSIETYGNWQRAALDELQQEMTENFRRVMSLLRQSLEGQDSMIDSTKSVTESLEQVQHLDDIREVRKLVRTQVQTINALVEQQAKSTAAMKEQFHAALDQLEVRLEEVQSTGSIDALTRIPNRAALDFYLQAICHKAAAENKPYSLAMVDLDNFKQINDSYGHQAGDTVLNFVVERLTEGIGKTGFVARYGGDEFAVVFTGDASQLAKRLRKVIDEVKETTLTLETKEGRKTVRVGLSAGVTALERNDTVSSSLLKADTALYDSKQAGKGTVTIFSAKKSA